MSPTLGAAAPDFTLPQSPDGTVTLSSLRGAPVVLFFYPRDDTTGCTREATDFSALAKDFKTAGVKVFGISKDTLASHAKFRRKHGLTIPLLSDAETTVSEDWGVWVEKSMYGRNFMGIERTTFLIGADGAVARIWEKVKVPGHADEVLAVVKGA